MQISAPILRGWKLEGQHRQEGDHDQGADLGPDIEGMETHLFQLGHQCSQGHVQISAPRFYRRYADGHFIMVKASSFQAPGLHKEASK